MPHSFRKCSECPESLEGKGPLAKTCSDACRGKRSRRLKRQKSEAGKLHAMPDHQRELTERVTAEQADVAHKVIEEEIRPVVRETITQDTLDAIGRMVALTTAAVEAIANDLASDDPQIRQRAYTLIMKYTVGHQAIVRPPEEEAGGTIHVNFQLPRPDSGDDIDGSAEEIVDAVEMKECDSCHRDKPVIEFIANSTRCTECYNAQQKRAEELLRTDATD